MKQPELFTETASKNSIAKARLDKKNRTSIVFTIIIITLIILIINAIIITVI